MRLEQKVDSDNYLWSTMIQAVFFLSMQVMQSRSPETILMGPEHSLGYGHVQADRQSPSQLSHPSSWDFRTLGMASEALLRRSSCSPISGDVTRMDDLCEPLSQVCDQARLYQILWDVVAYKIKRFGILLDFGPSQYKDQSQIHLVLREI